MHASSSAHRPTYLHFPLLETSCVSSTVCSHVVSSRFLLVCYSKELRFTFNPTRTFHTFVNRNSQNMEQTVLLLKSPCFAFSFLFVITPPPPAALRIIFSHQIFCYSCFFHASVPCESEKKRTISLDDHFFTVCACIKCMFTRDGCGTMHVCFLGYPSFSLISFILKQFALLKIDLMSFSNRNEAKKHLVHKGTVFAALGPCLLPPDHTFFFFILH